MTLNDKSVVTLAMGIHFGWLQQTIETVNMMQFVHATFI